MSLTADNYGQYSQWKLDLNMATAGSILAGTNRLNKSGYGVGHEVSTMIIANKPKGGYTNWNQIEQLWGVGPRKLALIRAAFYIIPQVREHP